jgi:NAD+ diphosphatase
MPDPFIASVAPGSLHSQPARWFIFSRYKLLVKSSGDATEVPSTAGIEQLGVACVRNFFIGTIGGVPCHAAEAQPSAEAPEGFVFEELRNLYECLDAVLYQAALTAVHLIEWDRNCQFCGHCRGAMTHRTDLRAKECTQCLRLEFPRVSPAIIVAIEKDDKLLLARSGRFPLPFFSVLAGFVEPGESLEKAVHREVLEETGIRVKNVQYFGSQPWPFPDSLMIGFTAQYDSGDIKIDGEEIVEAGWFRASELPQIPGKLSIARQLIDWFIAKQEIDHDKAGNS